MSFAEGTPTARITLGGKKREIGFTIGAMRRIKEELGSLQMPDMEDEGALLVMPVMVWACLAKEDRAELSKEDVEELIHPGNMAELSDIVGDLFLRSQPEGAEGNARKPARKPAGRKSTSTGSGRSASSTSG